MTNSKILSLNNRENSDDMAEMDESERIAVFDVYIRGQNDSQRFMSGAWGQCQSQRKIFGNHPSGSA